jgi:competence protein ComEC
LGLGLAFGLIPALALAALLGTLDRRHSVPAPPPRGGPVLLKGWIDSAPERAGSGWRASLEVEDVLRGDSLGAASDWRRVRLRVRARVALPPYGSLCVWHGRVRPARPPRNFDAYDERGELRAVGAAGVLEVESVRILPGARGPAWRREAIEPLRTRLAASLRATLAPAQAGLLGALVLGTREGVDPRTADAWRGLGISHILSISGMHVGLVATALLAVAGTPRRRKGILVLLGGVWLYSALGGLGPTLLRSSLMATWAALALYLGRGRQPLAALGLASLGLLWSGPERRYDVGLQLSCLSTAGLLVWSGPLARLAERLSQHGGKGRALAWLVASGGIGIAAQAATLPLVVWHFGQISWCSPLANLLFVPLTDIALGLGLAGSPLALLSGTLARPLWLVSGGLLYAAEHLSQFVTGSVETRVLLESSLACCVAAAIFAAAILAGGLAHSRGRRRSLAGCLGCAALACGFIAWRSARPALPAWRLEALDVGQGDALVLTLGTATWLVDTGDAQPADKGARVVVPHLQRLGVRRLRGVVLTHPHRDHCGGAGAVLRAVAVDTLYLAAASRTDTLYQSIRAAAPGVPVRFLATGSRLELGPGYEARVLWPDSTDVLRSGPNGCSVVLWARGERFPDLLAMGDLETDGEARLLETWRAALVAAAPDLLVLKAGHHGSRTSSTPALLDAADPELALVSVGVHNRYGHPSARTLAALAAHGCTVLRTDRGGAVRLCLRGTMLWLERPGERARSALAPERPG